MIDSIVRANVIVMLNFLNFIIVLWLCISVFLLLGNAHCNIHVLRALMFTACTHLVQGSNVSKGLSCEGVAGFILALL